MVLKWILLDPRAYACSHCLRRVFSSAFLAPSATRQQKKCQRGVNRGQTNHSAPTLGRRYHSETITDRPDSTMEELTLTYVDTIPVGSKGAVFTIGDYGTNDGAVSMPLLTKIIKRLRGKHGDDLAIHVVYEDQEKHDYNSLFSRLCGQDSYMSDFSNVYPMATNIGFYKQCVPDHWCDVIYSSSAVHWLQKPKTGFRDGIFQFSLQVTDDEFRRFQAEAASQWETFLLLRARELKPGGILAVMGVSLPDNFRELIQQADVINGSDDAISRTGIARVRLGFDLDHTWREMKNRGIITQDEYRNFFLPIATRTRREITKPFEEVTSPARHAGLTLEYIDEVLVRDPLNASVFPRQYAGAKAVREYFAEHMVSNTKGLISSHLHDNLRMRREEEKQKIMETFFELFRQRIEEVGPESYSQGNSSYFRLIARKTN